MMTLNVEISSPRTLVSTGNTLNKPFFQRVSLGLPELNATTFLPQMWLPFLWKYLHPNVALLSHLPLWVSFLGPEPVSSCLPVALRQAFYAQEISSDLPESAAHFDSCVSRSVPSLNTGLEAGSYSSPGCTLSTRKVLINHSQTPGREDGFCKVLISPV